MPNSTYSKEVLAVAEGAWLVTELEISFVSACPQGANPGAKVMLKKEQIMPENKDTKKETAINIDMDGLTKSLSTEVQAVVKGLLEKKDSLSAEVMTDAVIASMSKSLARFKAEIEKGLGEQVNVLQKQMDEALTKAKTANVSKEADDEVLKMGDKVFRKSDIGASAFDTLSFVHKEQQATQARLNKERLEMRVEKEYPHVAGKPEDKALLLKAIEDLPETAKAAALSLLKQLNETGEKMTKEIGHNGNRNTGDGVAKALPSDTDASLKLDKMAADYAKEKNITKSAAYEAVLRTEEGMALYNAHRQGE